jgi:catechol 2,3-dioxygenase-like lactoylglutathione lyase family enzyme
VLQRIYRQAPQSQTMTRIFLAFAAAFLSLAGTGVDQPARPKITGIAYVHLYVSNMDRSRAFYGGVLGLPASGGNCAKAARPCFPINWYQEVELEQVLSPGMANWLAEIAFATDDAAKLRAYLVAHGVKADAISTDGGGPPRFALRDPEGNRISFVQRPAAIADYEISANQVSSRLLHAGFVVRDAAAENRFYCDLLGFRVYWHGGFKDDGADDWYEIQVPDGENWIEYMLNIPANADHKELGVQNHFSLGVKDAQAAAALLRKHGLQTFDGPEVGRDGKNSLDAYDPDGTRVEVMDFAPTQKPCCHPYEAPHPTP